MPWFWLIITFILLFGLIMLLGSDLNQIIVYVSIDLAFLIVIGVYLFKSRGSLHKEFKKIELNNLFLCSAVAFLFSFVVAYYNFPYLISSIERKEILFPLNIGISKVEEFSYYRIAKMLLFAPIFEEIFYRYILQNRLSKSIHFIWSIIVIGILFSVFHLDLNNFSSLAVMGVFLGVIYHYTRNLFLVIYTHGFYNLLILFTTDSESSFNLWEGFIIIFLVNSLLIFLIHRFVKFNSNRRD